MTFTDSISTCFSKFATFKGRASRSEYWWFFLFVAIISWALDVGLNLQILNNQDASDSASFISGLVNFILLIPCLAVGSRRLHDIGRTGWWQLLLLTGIGWILLIYWYAKEGEESVNKFGTRGSQ